MRSKKKGAGRNNTRNPNFKKKDVPNCEICGFTYNSGLNKFMKGSKRHTCRFCSRSICDKPICSSRKNKQTLLHAKDKNSASLFNIMKGNIEFSKPRFRYCNCDIESDANRYYNISDEILKKLNIPSKFARIELCGPCRVQGKGNDTKCVLCSIFGSTLSRKIKKEVDSSKYKSQYEIEVNNNSSYNSSLDETEVNNNENNFSKWNQITDYNSNSNSIGGSYNKTKKMRKKQKKKKKSKIVKK